jgi:hypothetical protein
MMLNLRIESMLSGKDSHDFLNAVFITENAYFDNQYSILVIKLNSYNCFFSRKKARSVL